MDNIRDFVNKNLWTIALVLGAVSAAALIWRQSATPQPPALESTPGTQPVALQATPTRRVQTTSAAGGLLPTITATPPPPTNTPTPIPVYYVVEPGDVPLAIAAAYSVSINTLLETNSITDPTRLQIGQELLIPVTVTPSPTAPTPTPTKTTTPSPTPEPVYHIVAAGNTLSHIAVEHNVNLDLLLIANNMSSADTLQIGQELLIPSADIEIGLPTVVHQIKSGDTFSHLSFFYGSTVDDILDANPGLDPTSLQIGQKVIIPVTSPPTNPDADPGLPQIISPDPLLAGLTSLQTDMINAVNNQRQTRSLPPLKNSNDLTTMALAHAQDMVVRGYFAHTTPEGSTLKNRFNIHNIEANWTGENIQRNVKPKEITVAEAIRWFMSSAPHKANILHNRYNQIGVGVAEGPPGWYTFVLVFAER